MRIDIALGGHPRISMGLLGRHGTFVSDVRDLAFKLGEGVVLVRFYCEHVTLRFTWKSSVYDQHQLIAMGSSELKFDSGRYFVCPLMGRLTSELHLVGGKFGCR